MSKIRPEHVVMQLNDLLDQEKEAILSGKLGKLEEIAQKKIDLIGSSAVAPGGVSELSDLRRKAARNEILLQMAAEGIRDVARRMGAMADVRSGLKTYDRTGKSMQNISEAARTVKRRS